MALSNRDGHLVLSTGNKSELAVGYCTLYGDMAGGFALLSDVPKTLVYALARQLNRGVPRIPLESIEKEPSAELRPNQKDRDFLRLRRARSPGRRAGRRSAAGPGGGAQSGRLGFARSGHRSPDRPQRVQAPAGASAPQGDGPGLRRGPPLSDRAEVQGVRNELSAFSSQLSVLGFRISDFGFRQRGMNSVSKGQGNEIQVQNTMLARKLRADS